jgi:hypothetical protein
LGGAVGHPDQRLRVDRQLGSKQAVIRQLTR